MTGVRADSVTLDVALWWNGTEIRCRAGETVAVALLCAGRLDVRRSPRTGSPWTHSTRWRSRSRRGAANALLPAFSPPALADALERLRPTHLFLALAHLAACAGTGLLDFLFGHGIAKFKLPERLEVVEEMPLTPTRKVIKGRLRPP